MQFIRIENYIINLDHIQLVKILKDRVIIWITANDEPIVLRSDDSQKLLDWLNEKTMIFTDIT
jgi:hypothetical protein